MGAPLGPSELSAGWLSSCGNEGIVCSFSPVRFSIVIEWTIA